MSRLVSLAVIPGGGIYNGVGKLSYHEHLFPMNLSENFAKNNPHFFPQNNAQNFATLSNYVMQPAKNQENIESNPYLSKYEEKLKEKMKEKQAENLKELLEESKKDGKNLLDEAPIDPNLKFNPKKITQKSQVPKLDDVLIMENMMDKDRDHILQTWCFHLNSSDKMFGGGFDSKYYQNLTKNLKEFPNFVIPLPKDEGYLMTLVEYNGGVLGFTSLAEFQVHKENATPHLQIHFFEELSKEKDLVLFRGIFNGKGDVTEGQFLVSKVMEFYDAKDTNKLQLVKNFNQNPATFDYKSLIPQQN